VTGCNDQGASCTQGWNDRLAINGTIYYVPDKSPGGFYSTQQQSLAAYQAALAGGGLEKVLVSQIYNDNAYSMLVGPITFTLLASIPINFLIMDDPIYYSDNVGGVSLSVTDPAPTPLPAALPLFATGLGITSLLMSRRKRKVAPETTAV
jgi:hypothetical protein